MEFNELLRFIEVQDKKLLDHFQRHNIPQGEEGLSRLAKLMEEVGELSSEILAFNGNQRQEKLDIQNDENLSKEIADVIITTLLLAKTFDIDVKGALQEKIAILEKRFQ